MTDLVVFRLRGDAGLRTIRLGNLEPKGWLKPNLVLAACQNNGWYRLYCLCDSNPYRNDRPCSEYPRPVDQVWQAFNPSTLQVWGEDEAAEALLNAGLIDRIWLDRDGRITHKGKDETQ